MKFLFGLLTTLFSVGCGSSSTSPSSDVKEARVERSAIPFPADGCRAELRRITNEAGYPKLYQRLLDGSKQIDSLGPQVVATNSGILNALVGLQNDLIAAQNVVAQNLAKSPCLAVIADMKQQNFSTTRLAMLNPEAIEGDRIADSLVNNYRLAKAYEPPRKKLNRNIHWFLPYRIFDRSNGQGQPDLYARVFDGASSDTGAYFNLATLFVSVGNSSQTLQQVQKLQQMANSVVGEIGYFGYWEEPDSFEVAYNEQVTKLLAIVQKAGLQFEGQDAGPISGPIAGPVVSLREFNSSAVDSSTRNMASISAIQQQQMAIAAQVSVAYLDAAGTQHKEGKEVEANASLAMATEVIRAMADVAVGVSPAGRAKDIIEAATGRSIIPDFKELTQTERILAAVGAFLPIGGSGLKTVGKVFETRVGRKLGEAFFSQTARFRVVLGLSDEAIEAGKLLKVTQVGAKVYALLHEPLKSLPNGLKVLRVREGAEASKIAVIGRSMAGVVRDTAEHLRGKGISVVTFEPSAAAATEFGDAVRKYQTVVGNASARLPVEEVMKTLSYAENKAWIEKIVGEGYMVLDMGDPLGRDLAEGMSAFYQLEKQVTFGL